jgi:hypothetical protein
VCLVEEAESSVYCNLFERSKELAEFLAEDCAWLEKEE